VTNSCRFKIIARTSTPATPAWGHPSSACISVALGASIGACRVVRDVETGSYRAYNQKDGWGINPPGPSLFPVLEKLPEHHAFVQKGRTPLQQVRMSYLLVVGSNADWWRGSAGFRGRPWTIGSPSVSTTDSGSPRRG